jgi:hypothetical protein
MIGSGRGGGDSGVTEGIGRAAKLGTGAGDSASAGSRRAKKAPMPSSARTAVAAVTVVLVRGALVRPHAP